MTVFRLYQVRDNFTYRIGQITPTETQEGVREGFEEWPHEDEPPGNVSGSARLYQLFRRGAGKDNGTSATGADRHAVHQYDLVVMYPSAMRHADRERLIAQDRNDLINGLTITATDARKGHADNTTADVGLELRHRVSDRVVREGELFYLILRWDCTVHESEV